MHIPVLVPCLIELNLCQPLLLHQPDRYQVCITSLQKAMQQAYISTQGRALLYYKDINNNNIMKA